MRLILPLLSVHWKLIICRSHANSIENINQALNCIDVAVRKIDRKPAHA